MLPAEVTLTPATEQDFAVLRELAGTIWRQHYAGIISADQIEYMLAGRFSHEALREHSQATDRWLELLRVSGAPAGYCEYELADMQGSERTLPAVKLGQLYVLQSHRGNRVLQGSGFRGRPGGRVRDRRRLRDGRLRDGEAAVIDERLNEGSASASSANP